MSERRAICARGHGYAVGDGCLDCMALERERYLKAVPLADTLERIEMTAPATGPWSDAAADILADLAALAAPFLPPTCTRATAALCSCDRCLALDMGLDAPFDGTGYLR